MRSLFFLAISCLLTTSLWGQKPPQTNVYVFDLKQVTDNKWEFSNPKYLTFFNKNGYNNQPKFFNNDQLYVTVQFPYEEQPELYLLNLKDQTKTRITDTREGEYSPTLMPNKNFFSAVRVEADANKTQRLWEFPVNRRNNGKPVFKYITGIGYHHWLNNNEVALFMLGEPNYLALADTRTDKTRRIDEKVGRAFQTLPNGSLAYVRKTDDYNWYITEYNTYRKQSKQIIQTLPGAEDFIVLNDGSILMGKGSKIFKYHPSYDKNWIEVVDLRYYNINNISRMAISADNKIAIVGN
ncbi:MAG: hypothetical protein AB8G22_07725 [Saprospiraceae bacterium]